MRGDPVRADAERNRRIEDPRPVEMYVCAVALGDAAQRDPYHRALLGAIETARQRVLLTTAYLVPPRRLLRKLVEAAQRGVQVELLLPGFSDSWPALHAGRSHYGPLLRAGVQRGNVELPGFSFSLQGEAGFGAPGWSRFRFDAASVYPIGRGTVRARLAGRGGAGLTQ